MTINGHWTEIDQASIRDELAAMFEQVRKAAGRDARSLMTELAGEIGFPEQNLKCWLAEPPDGHCMYRVPKSLHAALFKRLG